MQDTTIRPAAAADVSQIMVLRGLHAEFEAGSISGTEEQLEALLFGEGATVQCLVAEVGGRVVGYATFMRQQATWRASSYLFLDTLFLLENVRGRGLGTRLMERVREEARRMGCRLIEWQTPDFNVDAIRFYRGLGAVSLAKERFVWDVHTAKSVPRLSGEDEALAPSESALEPYRPRPTTLTGERDCHGWRLKIYEITLDGAALPAAVVDAALGCAQSQVTWPLGAQDKLGFLILHSGQDKLWSIVHLWIRDILRQFVFCAPLNDPTRFGASPMPGFNACVWELEVTRHERDAWVRHVMALPNAPQFEAYMRDGLELA